MGITDYWRPSFAAIALACFLALGSCEVSMAATPVVSRITPARVLPGQWVTIHGKGLKETSAIWSERVSERFSVVSDTEIKWFVNPLSAQNDHANFTQSRRKLDDNAVAFD